MSLLGIFLVILGGALLSVSIRLEGGRFPWLRKKIEDLHTMAHELGLIRIFGTEGVVFLAFVAVFLLLFFFGFLGAVAILLFVLLGPRWVRNYLKGRRQRRFESLLPEALETIANSLKVGLSFAQAIQPLSKDFPEPIRSVFAEALRAIQVGTPIGEALKEAGREYPTREWWLFVEAVTTLLRMGGNLAEITAKAADTLRRRQRIEERLQTLTAQGRMQALVMGGLPVGMLFVLKGLDPPSYNLLTGTLRGWFLLAIAFLLEGVAILLIRRILALEV